MDTTEISHQLISWDIIDIAGIIVSREKHFYSSLSVETNFLLINLWNNIMQLTILEKHPLCFYFATVNVRRTVNWRDKKNFTLKTGTTDGKEEDPINVNCVKGFFSQKPHICRLVKFFFQTLDLRTHMKSQGEKTSSMCNLCQKSLLIQTKMNCLPKM